MATWTTLPDSALEPGKPIRSIDALALRDNPVAITEGAAGAPKIQAQALDTTADEKNWVLGRIIEASVGDVGTYAWLGETTATSTAPGATRAGSNLRYVGVNKIAVSWSGASANLTGGLFTVTPAGTWRCMGSSLTFTVPELGATYPATLWLRIA
jgi:hypothetical protein